MNKDILLGMMMSGGTGGGGGSVVVPNINATATTLPAGSDATVTKSGSNTNVVFAFGIPQGDPGEQGPMGAQGLLGRKAHPGKAFLPVEQLVKCLQKHPIMTMRPLGKTQQTLELYLS